MIKCPHCKEYINKSIIKIDMAKEPRYKVLHRAICPHCNKEYYFVQYQPLMMNITKGDYYEGKSGWTKD